MTDSLNGKKVEEKSASMSWSGVGNAAAGTAIVDIATKYFTPEHKKPVTKGDLIKLSNRLSRYVRIEDLEPNLFGQKPYLKIETGKIIYR